MNTAPRILIVGSEASLRLSLALILKQDGYFITTASNAREALFQLGQKSMPQFDLVFLDSGLPDASGIELVSKIHELMPRIPVVLLDHDPKWEIRARNSAMEYIPYNLRPVLPSEVLRRAHEYVG